MTDSRLFYNHLQQHDVSLEELLSGTQFFKPVPEDWHVVVIDVKNSTLAVKNGRHPSVNLAATGSIITVLNEIKRKNKKLRIPYFFGGDGTTFIVPDFCIIEVLDVLENYRHHVKENMQLMLRLGSKQIREVYESTRILNLAKLKVNDYLTIPILLGTGLKDAEKMIKASFIDDSIDANEIIPVDLEGMECRWQEIQAPNDKKKIICLLLSCPIDELQRKIYLDVIKEISRIFGDYESRQAISTKKLKLNLSISTIKKEMFARLGKNDNVYLIKNWLITIIGKYYFKWFKEGREYLRQVRQLSYTLMIDGTFNHVFSGSQSDVDELVAFLDDLESEKMITYGIHITHASVMSCYVKNRKKDHIHFVDGTGGGFTTASLMYKAKLIKSN